MPYYHVRLFYYVEREPPRIQSRDQLNLKKTYMVKEIVEPYLKGASFRFGAKVLKKSDVADIQIRETSTEVSPLFYTFESGTNVTNNFISKLRKEETPTPKRVVVSSKNVFIVHGRDDKPKLELARMLEKLGFNVIILSEQPDKGRTIIEKLEQETIDIGYAFVILTPDDIGAVADKWTEIGVTLMTKEAIKQSFETATMRYRARQNVILELGYFVGKIGRDRVCCLYKGDVELPSDIHGVLFKKFDKSVKDCYEGIIEELKAADYEIKM